MLKIKHAEKHIEEMFPDFPLSKKWNKYSIMISEDMTRFTVVREPKFKYKVRATLILPFIFIPYCFYYGWINVKKAIYDSYKGCWACLACTDERAYTEVMRIYSEKGAKGGRLQDGEQKEDCSDREVNNQDK